MSKPISASIGQYSDFVSYSDLSSSGPSASETEAECLKAGASHKLLKAAQHEKCWKCGRELYDLWEVISRELSARLALTLDSLIQLTANSPRANVRITGLSEK